MSSMSAKLKNAEPYNLFFSPRPDVKGTQDQQSFITFGDLLCSSLGNLKYSLQITNTLDLEWLMDQYDKAGYGKVPLTILYGAENPEVDEYMKKHVLPNVSVRRIQSSDPYGKHHTKMSIYVYDDNSLRVVVSSANADSFSWTKYGQITWISPLCPPRSGLGGSGPTNFRGSLLQYLKIYPFGMLKNCVSYIENADFSNVKVFLVMSLPGGHRIGDYNAECHLERVAELLSMHCKLPEDESKKPWPIVVQASSIGNIGTSADNWLTPSLLRSIGSHKYNQKPMNSKATVQVIYPTEQNVLDSLSNDANPQRHINFFLTDFQWARNMLCSWKSEQLHLTKIIPRTKCYCRRSPCGTKLAWFLMTSANMSKSAWGGRVNRYSEIYVRSFEVGVLFLPKFFEEDYFKIKGENQALFPLIFDVPLTSYTREEEPWCDNSDLK